MRRYMFSLLIALGVLTCCPGMFAQMTMQPDKTGLLLTTGESINAAINVTSRNIANFKTVGYKRQRVNLQDGKIIDMPRIWNQGRLLMTNTPLDLAIDGGGFFRVLQPDGQIAYTRDGSMRIDKDGKIITSNGDALDPQICLPQNPAGIIIRPGGSVEIMQPGASQTEQVGQIELAHFQNPAGLKTIGPALFEETPASGEPSVTTPGENDTGKLLQGFVEDSNVEIMEELNHLRTLQLWKRGVDQALLAIQEEQGTSPALQR